MTDLHRRIIKALQKHLPGIQATLVREKKHVVIDFTCGDMTQRVTVSKSPKNKEHEYRNTCTLVCKAFGLSKINH